MESDDARRALLGRLIDHAPTFPPASLTPAAALAEDARALVSPHAFALARLVWPASRFEELPPSERAISAVLDVPLPDGARVQAVEMRYREGLAELTLHAGEAYVEVAIDDALDERLDALVEHGLRAKVRCGGDQVPTDVELARFVRACAERDLVFKATAGLHHAVRSNGEHGVLNLLAAVVFTGDEEAALGETDAAAFGLDAHAFSWRERQATGAELGRVRRERLHSIGSCNFFEPVEELEALGMVPA
jgi:hypothetical protein